MHFHSAARWIWLANPLEGPNQYVNFHRSFTLRRKPRKAILQLAVDTQYALFVNGREIPGRAFPDYPHHRSVDRHNLTEYLVVGRNTLAILGYFFGQDNSEYRKGRAGLLLQLTMDGRTLVSNAGWRARLSPGFLSVPAEPVTRQMGFTVRFDARREDDWTAPRYRPGRDWRPAAELAGPTDGYWTHLEPRRQPPLTQGEPRNGRIIACGALIRPPSASPDSPAEAVAADFKRTVPPAQPRTFPLTLAPPTAPANGALVVVDLGEESFGLLHLDVDAPAGTHIDIAHGEHLDDLGVRATPGYRRFGDRLICREGHNRFTLPFRRLGCRYIEIHLLAFQRPVTLRALGLAPVSYPVVERGDYRSPDRLMSEIRTAALRTLRRCMAEHYMDCPWREQSLYAYDSRNQALYGYYAFGEYAYPIESFRLLGWGRREDGFLELCAPARVKTCIPTFSLVWISALRDHFLFSGRPLLFREFRATAADLLHTFLNHRDTKTGLCNIFDGHWAFYEWIEGLDYKPEPTFTADGKFRLDAPHNLYVLEALRAFGDLLEYSGDPAAARPYRREAARLAAAIHRVFWDPRRRRYASYADRRSRWHYAVGVQGLALTQGVCPPPLRARLQAEMLTDSTLIPVTLSALFYAWQAMLNAAPQQQQQVLDHCLTTFGQMVLQGGTTLWEVVGGGGEFGLAGSLCHGWSAAPIWLQQAYILGVRPTAPGFATFLVQPHLCGLPAAAGIIPTPRGPIRVAWSCRDRLFQLRLDVPRGLTPVIRRPPGFQGRCEVRIRGRRIDPIKP